MIHGFKIVLLALCALALAADALAQEQATLPGPPPKAPPGFAAVLKASPYGGYWVLLPTGESPPPPSSPRWMRERRPAPPSAAQPNFGQDTGAPYTPPAADYPEQTAPPLTADSVGLELERAIVDAINDRRIAAGLAPLQPHPLLANAAREHSEEMGRLGYFAHESPTSGRQRFTDRISLAGVVDTGKAGENLQKAPASLARTDLDDAASTFAESWMDSPGHRDNILDDGFVFTGVGVFVGPSGIYATQLFTARVDAP